MLLLQQAERGLGVSAGLDRGIGMSDQAGSMYSVDPHELHGLSLDSFDGMSFSSAGDEMSGSPSSAADGDGRASAARATSTAAQRVSGGQSSLGGGASDQRSSGSSVFFEQLLGDRSAAPAPAAAAAAAAPLPSSQQPARGAPSPSV